MTTVIDQTSNTSLVLNVTIAVILCLVINSIIFGIGWDGGDESINIWFAPPGYVVGTVWVILFGLIGASRYLLNSAGEWAKGTKALLVGLLLFCLAYPIYTIGFNSEFIGLLGNIATILFTVFAMYRTWKFSRAAAYLLSPIVLWVTFATILVLAELRWISV